MLRTNTALSVFVLLVTLGAPRLAAQPVPIAERAERLGTLFTGLGAAQLRVETWNGTIESGILGSVRPDTFVLEGVAGPTAIDYRDVEAVSREGGHAIQGAFWGASAGALAGGFFGVMVHSYDCVTPVSCNESENKGGIRGALIVGTVGAVLGYVLGRHQSHWHPIYP